MKKYRKPILVLLAILALGGSFAGGAAVFAGERAGFGQRSETAVRAEPSPAPASSARDRAVIAKGKVVPVHYASLSMPSGGVVAEILVKEGEAVAAGQVILRLRNEHQQAALAQADATVAGARAQLEMLKAGPQADEIAAAQATLDAANARRSRLNEAGRAADVTAARAAVAAAEAALQHLYQGPDGNVRAAAAADLLNAQAAVGMAQAAYDKIKDRPDRGIYPQSLQLEQATNAMQAAKARYEELLGPPKSDSVAQATAQIRQAQANLDRLLVPATPAEIAEAEALARQAQAQLDLLRAGARQQQIAAAEAAVTLAEASRRQAEVSLSDTELAAPFAGTLAVLYVRTGEQIGPGVPAADLGDLTAWQVETDDLSELDIVRVRSAQEVNLTFDAIRDLTLRGTVDRIQPKGEKKLGDMTYTAFVRVANADPRLLWNMTAVVEIP